MYSFAFYYERQRNKTKTKTLKKAKYGNQTNEMRKKNKNANKNRMRKCDWNKIKMRKKLYENHNSFCMTITFVSSVWNGAKKKKQKRIPNWSQHENHWNISNVWIWIRNGEQLEYMSSTLLFRFISIGINGAVMS